MTFNPLTGKFDDKGVTEHGALTGLLDDDHAQYFLSDGTRQINSAYLLPSADGTATYLVKTNGAGQWGYVDPSTIGMSQDQAILWALAY